MTVTDHRQAPVNEFHHEALVYRDEAGFVAGTTSFIREGLAADEAILVAVVAPKIRLLRDALGADADRVLFADMLELGRNPARIIPAWRQFVDDHVAPGRPARGIGEPIWVGRRPVEVLEAQLHEALLNVAFDGGPGWRLQCPYDATQLDESVLSAARSSHRHVRQADGARSNGAYPGDRHAVTAFGAPLDEPAGASIALVFDARALPTLRDAVLRQGALVGVTGQRLDDLALAAHEMVTNSIRHGGGRGSVRMWSDRDAFVIEVRDHGRVRDLLAGRTLPDRGAECGRGLWLANQLCDLVQLRSGEAGTTVRLITWLG
ncbi:MAG: anti-sigma factor RsbA family regulatory protein [Frankiaceae bacterium]